MLDRQWFPGPSRAEPEERETGDECRKTQREETARQDGSPGRKNISAPQLMTAELPLVTHPPPPPQPQHVRSEGTCFFGGVKTRMQHEK